jgi:hypothetical protein
LEKYCENGDLLKESVAELLGGDFLLREISIIEDLLTQILENQEKFCLEPCAVLLESLTIQQLTDVGKVASSCVRKVILDNFVEVHETADNPFYGFQEYLENLGQNPGENFLG